VPGWNLRAKKLSVISYKLSAAPVLAER